MTLCRSWPLYGVLALALVVRATCADDCPAKAEKATNCCKEKQAKQSAEKCCFEEMIRGLVQLGQMCDSTCSPCDADDAECQKCPESCTRQIAVGISLSKLGPIPFFVPSISIEYSDGGRAAMCAPCQPAADAKKYCVQSIVRRQKGESAEVFLCPTIMVPAGQRAGCRTNQCSLDVEVKDADPGFAHVELTISQPEGRQPGNACDIVPVAISKAEARVPLGKMVKLPLNPAMDSCQDKTWLQGTVGLVIDEHCATKCCDAEPKNASCAVDCCSQCSQPVCASPYYAECVPAQAARMHTPEMIWVRAIRTPRGELMVEPPASPMPAVAAPMPSRMMVGGAYLRNGCLTPVAGHAVPEILPAPVARPCSIFAAPQAYSKGAVIRAAHEKEGLEVECGSDCAMSFPDMTLKLPGCSPCTLRSSGERVEISTPFVTALADSVVINIDGDSIKLEGNVKLTYHNKQHEGPACGDSAHFSLTEGNMSISLTVNEKPSE